MRALEALFAQHRDTYPVMNPEHGPLLQLLQEIDRVVLPIDDQACGGSKILGGMSLQQFYHHDRRTWRRPSLYQETMLTWHILVDVYQALWIPAGKSEQAILEGFIESHLLPPLLSAHYSPFLALRSTDDIRMFRPIPTYYLRHVRPACSRSLFSAGREACSSSTVYAGILSIASMSHDGITVQAAGTTPASPKL